MLKKAIIDSGPIIALFDKDDKYHKEAINFVENFRGELFSTYAVVTEVTHLLDFSIQTQIDFIRWITEGGITIANLSIDDLLRIIELVNQYSDLPMDFADATLVVVCENEKIYNIVSIDKDFFVYRTRDKKHLKNIFLI